MARIMTGGDRCCFIQINGQETVIAFIKLNYELTDTTGGLDVLKEIIEKNV